MSITRNLLILLFTIVLAAAGTSSFAQCGGHFVFTSSKTEHVDDSGNVDESVTEKTRVEVNGNAITVLISGPNDHKMTGTVTTNACNWTVPFKEGKSALTIRLSDESGENREFAVSIEGKAGKVTLTATSGDGSVPKIRLKADQFAPAD